jgi:hypothetical protein
MLPSGRDPQQSVVLYRGETSILGDDGRRWLVVNYELEAA